MILNAFHTTLRPTIIKGPGIMQKDGLTPRILTSLGGKF